ncbi:MAG: hypothetical protein KBB88_00765 [Candidatus Pacebacteria bacterium]|nr:hypothetical protein [Candidatus Paceibacterota bacterium]
MLYEFYGKECPHCIAMHPLIEKLEKEFSLVVEKKEVWHNKENSAELQTLDGGSKCGGVPFFWNSDTETYLCGSVVYEELKKWAGK